MELLQVDDTYKLQINPVAFGISCIKKLFDEDESEDKALATDRLAYVVLMHTPHLDYFLNNADDEELRSEIVLKDMDRTGDEDFISPVTKEVEEWFKGRTKEEIVVAMYQAATSATSIVRKELGNPQKLLALKKKNGDPVYTIDHILKVLNMMPETMEKLDQAKKKVISRKDEGKSQFGQKTKNLFEDETF